MRLIQYMTEAEASPCVVSLGMFDGVHTGHTALLLTALETAMDNNLRFDIFTFSNHPGSVLGHQPPQITPFRYKVSLLSRKLPDTLYAPAFTPQLARMEPELFIRWLIETTGARCLVAGSNYSFGHKGRGDAQMLTALARRLGSDVIIIPPINGNDGKPVSSTVIRENVIKGDLQAVMDALGALFAITGPVVHGRRLGRTLGLPTVNIAIDPSQCLPPDGVYMAWAYNGVEEYPAVLNIGINPTIGGQERTVEAHLIGYKGVMYGRYVRISLIKRLRDERRFSSIHALQQQIDKDIAQTMEFIENVLLLDDVLRE